MTSECCHNRLEDFVSFKDPETPGTLEEICGKELGETEELKKECLKNLMGLVTKKGVTCIMRDDFLLRFLRYKKFRVQKSFEVLQNYAHMRTSLQEKIVKLEPEVAKRFLDLNILGFLPYRDQKERCIFFMNAGNWNPSILSSEDFLLTYVLLFSYITERQSSQITGFVSIYYCKCIPLSYLFYLMPFLNFLKNFLFECLPARYPQVHVISDAFLFKACFRLINPFLPKKIRERVLFHEGASEELSQHVSSSILPYEFGGNLGPLNNNHFAEDVLEYLKTMKDEQKYFLPRNC